jgi:glycosyltransferase involved in cell wall biosynthesis
MQTRPLRIAWLGPVPGGEAGARGAAAELVHGLAELGHHIDCFFPSAGLPLPAELAEHENLTFVWGTSTWRWNRWYSRGKLRAFATGLLARGSFSLRLRQEIMRRHRREPYDLIYQFSNIETPAVPARLTQSVPLVIHPETHAAGELRWLIAERRLGLRCQPAHVLAAVVVVMSLRVLVQRIAIRRARLVICISGVFRDHLVHDYGVRRSDTVVIPNPVRLERFTACAGTLAEPPRVLVLGRISVRKGIEDVVAVARTLLQRGVYAQIRVLGGPSLWSDYTKLLDDLPAENSEYAGHVAAAEVPAELARGDVLLQASKYEPFGLTVAEALAAGVPVVATSEVGAIEGVDRAVLTEVEPGDFEAMASAIATTIARLSENPTEIRAAARQEASRLFASQFVCEQVSHALAQLVDGSGRVPGEELGARVAAA